MPARSLVLVSVALLTGGCYGPRPSSLPRGDGWLVVVKTVSLPDRIDVYARFAQHSWIEVRRGSEDDWWLVEITGSRSGLRVEPADAEWVRLDRRWDERVSVLEVLSGPEAQGAGERVIELGQTCVDFKKREQILYPDGSFKVTIHPTQGRTYEPWPGPNSNSLTAYLLRGTPGLNAELHHNALGKDYPEETLHMGRSLAGLGFDANLPYLGIGMGLRQGVELRVIGLSLGVSLWPPALKIPFLPRIGVHQGWLGSH